MISTDKIKKLRKQTQASISDIQKALERAKGDEKQALEILRKKGVEIAREKSRRQATEGIVTAYIHQDRKTGVLLELRCETDFVARTPEFQELAHELALQVAGTNPAGVKELLAASYIRDPQKTILQLIQEYIAKLGENIQVARFVYFRVGEE